AAEQRSRHEHTQIQRSYRQRLSPPLASPEPARSVANGQPPDQNGERTDCGDGRRTRKPTAERPDRSGRRNNKKDRAALLSRCKQTLHAPLRASSNHSGWYPARVPDALDKSYLYTQISLM